MRQVPQMQQRLGDSIYLTLTLSSDYSVVFHSRPCPHEKPGMEVARPDMWITHVKRDGRFGDGLDTAKPCVAHIHHTNEKGSVKPQSY